MLKTEHPTGIEVNRSLTPLSLVRYLLDVFNRHGRQRCRFHQLLVSADRNSSAATNVVLIEKNTLNITEREEIYHA